MTPHAVIRGNDATCYRCHRLIRSADWRHVQLGGGDDVGSGDQTCVPCWPLDKAEERKIANGRVLRTETRMVKTGGLKSWSEEVYQ